MQMRMRPQNDFEWNFLYIIWFPELTVNVQMIYKTIITINT